MAYKLIDATAIRSGTVVMLDKEDLYTDVKGNQVEFYRLVEQCRKKCKELDATCLELKGVVFGHD